MNWTKNLISFIKNNDAGECPKCNSRKLEATEHLHGNRKSLTFACEVCKASIHFDGVTNN